MCGIIGKINRVVGQSKPLTEGDLSQLTHRGPDGFGIYKNDHVQLGHTRLAIIDLSDAGRQPMSSPDDRYIVTYNGEIYNFLELRAELESMGETFSSASDTEVLLVAYKVWGVDFVKHLRGMFAFAIWDDESKSLFLARDRCGEKPLFYWRDGEHFIFASELKALVPLLDKRPKLDLTVVDMYLHYQFVPEPYTLLDGVSKLPAAHTLMLTFDNWDAQPVRYWDVEHTSYDGFVPKDAKGIDESIREGLEDAVLMTLRSDVPVGIALSGGIDSGVIAALAQKNYPEPMHAFCIGYPGRPVYDERDQARALAKSLGMIVHEVELPVENFVNFFPDLVRIMDEPIADPAAFGHYSVPQAASEHGIKVLLTGIGGDEIFWGYDWVARAAMIDQFMAGNTLLHTVGRGGAIPIVQRLLPRIAEHNSVPNIARRLASWLDAISDTRTPQTQLRFYMAVSGFSAAFDLKSGIYGEAMRSVLTDNPFIPTDIGARTKSEIPAAVIRMLFDTWMVSNAVALGDRVSMSVGVEARLPFLDFRLIERVMALRKATPDHGLGQKSWLRSALKGVLPEEVLSRPKSGFTSPGREWLSGVISKYGEIMHDSVLVSEGIVDKAKVNYILTHMPKQNFPSLFFAYKLVLLEMWYRQVVLDTVK
ncbi:MAG: asparagine synthase (glutamine-hydrolyzing) [Polynucleobacter sp. 39-45-136]|jgi:asparagine synthase (glutamine-hydrolysing)|nr:MAG: asparagine synthase (glutamine-hydrolyzing) [Polynucleobacter sp. 39-45-136]